MSLSDSLGPLIVPPKRSDVQTPGRPAAQTPRRADVQPFGRLDAQPSERPGLPLQGTAKRSHPDFAKKTLYVRRSTMRDAFRKYQDAGGKEESDLVQMLLEQYAGGPRG